MHIRLTLVAMCFVFSGIARGDDPEFQRYSYVSWLYGGVTTIIYRKGGDSGSLALGDHVSSSAYRCPEDSDYVCFFAKDFAFAVPKNIGDTRSWSFRNETFELVDSDVSLVILDREFTGLALISRVPERLYVTPEQYFLFSPEHGLLGFGNGPTVDHDAHASWVRSTPGFGASASPK